MRLDSRTSRIASLLRAAAIVLLGSGGPAPAQTRPRPADIACVASAETRDLYVSNKLVQPLIVMREASRWAEAEAIDIQLCRTQGLLVYDVTLLDHEGRVIHRLVSATNGTAIDKSPAGTPAGLGGIGAPGLGSRPQGTGE